MRKIKVVMCPAERAPYVTNIVDSLKNLQKAVGGYIEMHAMSSCVHAVMNEEGRLKGLPENRSFPWPGFVGDIVIVATDGPEGDGGLRDLTDNEARLMLASARKAWNSSQMKEAEA